ncbi:hypothetical protein E2562_030496 [Oryza meyeriana var. granulata]|uniref:Uncharacterized protein n=1 Tax=Oryza meyeriana var. granulata TaxID=110450 RepID=A0A6G1CV40_9ORYZ|nr:hypothetical protein E2562_030496 [Oryza meyeriana var. granulata]
MDTNGELYIPESELQIGDVDDSFFAPDFEDVDNGCFVLETQEQGSDVGLVGMEVKDTYVQVEDSAADMEVEAAGVGVEASFFVPNSEDVDNGIFILNSEDMDDGMEVAAASMDVEVEAAVAEVNVTGVEVDDDALGMEVEEYYRPFYLSMLKIMLPAYFDRKSKLVRDADVKPCLGYCKFKLFIV